MAGGKKSFIEMMERKGNKCSCEIPLRNNSFVLNDGMGDKDIEEI